MNENDPKYEQTVLDNLKLVHYVLHQMYVPKEEYEDYFQEGVAELCRSILNFDDTKNTELSTYAVSNIRGRLRNYAASRVTTVHMSKRDQSYLGQIISGRLAEKSEDELLDELGITESKYQDLIRAFKSISIESSITEDSNSNELRVSDGSTIIDVLNNQVVDEILNDGASSLINKMNFYSEIHKQIYSEYIKYKILGVRVTQKDLAIKYNVTRQTVNNLVKKYDKRLRNIVKRTLTDKMY